MRLILLCAVLALATPAFAQEAKAPPKPTYEQLEAEVKRLSYVLQAVIIQRNQAMSQIADQAAMAEVEKALAQSKETSK